MNQLSDLEYFTDIRQSENDTNGIAFPVQRPPPLHHCTEVRYTVSWKCYLNT